MDGLELTSPSFPGPVSWNPMPLSRGNVAHMRTNPSVINGSLHALVTLDKSYCNERRIKTVII